MPTIDRQREGQATMAGRLALTQERVSELREELDGELKRRYDQVVEALDVEGMKPRQVAAALGLRSESSVYSILGHPR